MEISLISRGPNKGKLVVRYTHTDKFGNKTNKVELAPNTIAGRKKLENFIKNRPKPGEASRVVFTKAELEKIKKLKLKGLSEQEIVEQANIPKLKSTTPLKRLNLPSREDVVYKPREDKIKELAKTGKYTKSEIKEEIKKIFKVNISDRRLDPILKNYKIPTGVGSQKLKEKFALKTKYLKDYSFEDLETDIKAGKTRTEIAEELFNKNPEYYNKLKTSRGVKTAIATAIGDRLNKRPDLKKIDFLNLKKFKQEQKIALKDIRNFINKNKEAYKKVYASNKVGAVDDFKEKILDYVSQKYPKFLTRAKGDSSGKLLNNQRIFTAYNVLGREVTKKGESGKDVFLKKDIRKALGIPERPGKGEGASRDRLNREYNKRTTELLKLAQKQKLIPLIDPITGNPINSEAAYYRYVDRTQIDPIRNLFGKKYKFGQEHVGGIARATVVNDPKGLTQITAMDPYQNKFVKGTQFDPKAVTQLRLASQSSPEKAKEYLKIQNQILDESDKKFGLDQTRQKLVGDKIKTTYPKSSLDDSFLKKAQRAIKSFIATGRDKEPAFKSIDPYLQNAIKVVKKTGEFNPQANSFLRTALRRTGVAGLVGMIGVGMFGGSPVEAAEVKQPTVGVPLKYDATQGSIVNANTDQKADQNQILEYVKDNPLKVTAGTSLGFAAQEVPGAYKAARDLGRGRVRSALGISGALRPLLTTFGTPLLTGLYEGAIGAKRLEEGETMTDVLTDPLGPALGISLMEPLSKMSGVVRDAKPVGILGGLKRAFNPFDMSNVGTARPGLTSKILRMGMSPRVIAGISRLGPYGMLAGAGLSALDQYNKYQNQEGMIYNFLND